MRKFIGDFLIILILLLIVNVISYHYIIYSVLYEKYEKPARDLNNSIFYKDFILADSHGWALTNQNKSISERFASDSIFNFSYGSDSYGDLLVKLHWLIQNEIKIDHVLLTVDDHMMTKKSDNRNRTIIYSTANLHKEAYRISYFKYYYYYLKKYLPLLDSSNQKVIVEYLKTRFSFTENNSHKTWSSQTQKYRMGEVRRRLKTFFPNEKFELISLKVKNLNQIVKLCNDNNISIIPLKFPIDSMMISEMEHNYYLDSVEVFFKNLNDNNKTLNFQRKFNDPIMLSNADHINAIGADSLSMHIIKMIENQ